VDVAGKVLGQGNEGADGKRAGVEKTGHGVWYRSAAADLPPRMQVFVIVPDSRERRIRLVKYLALQQHDFSFTTRPELT